MSDAGPTKGDYSESNSWSNRPFVAGALRLTVTASPTVASFLSTHLLTRAFPPNTVDIHIILWWAMIIAVGLGVLIGTDRIMRRALPLVALFKLSLIFPDKAPSRFGVAMKTGTTKQLERQVQEIRDHGMSNDATKHAEMMLQMVATLSVHDRLTRGHCERVRAYTDMISEELGLAPLDAAKLRWAALLHDVGKLFVPAEILNKDGRPTKEEWDILKSHTWQGDKLIGPLKPWLGEWAAAVGSHHERWDGDGYPQGLAGNNIHLGARIVAVADTFDVITSKRSYKEPITADKARAEIARCAGTQFDPKIARAFLNIGLGRLRFAIGPLSWIANLPAAGQAAVAPVASPLATAAVAIASVGAAVASGNTDMLFAHEDPPATIAFIEETEEAIVVTTLPTTTLPPTTLPPTTTTLAPTTTTAPTTTAAPAAPTPTTATPRTTTTPAPLALPAVDNISVTLTEDGTTLVSIPVHTSTGDLAVTLTTAAAKGLVTISDPIYKASSGTARNGVIEFSYVANPNANGIDSFGYQVCDGNGQCAEGIASVTIDASNDAPVLATLASVSSQAGRALAITPSATDIDGDTLTFSATGLPSGLSINPATGRISGTLATGLAAGPRTIVVRVTDSGSPSLFASRTMTLTIVDAPPPVAHSSAVSATEDTPRSVNLTSTSFDGNLTYRVVTPPTRGTLGPIGTPTPAGRSTETAVSASATYSPNANANGSDSVVFEVCDFLARCNTATISLTITPVNDIPVVTPTAVSVDEDTELTVADSFVVAAASDVDSPSLFATWSNPPTGTFADSGSSISFTPDLNFNGTLELDYSICDGAGGCAPGVLTVTVNPINDDPVLASYVDQSGLIGGSVSLPATASDIDLDTLTFSATNLPNGLSINPSTGAISGTIGTSQSQSVHAVVVSVSDGTASVDQAFTFTVDATNPVLNGGARTTDEDTTYTVSFTGQTEVGTLDFTLVTPPTNGTISDFTASTGPIDWLTQTPFTSTLKYTPAQDYNGPDSFVIRACDSSALYCTDATITMTVTVVNDAPAIAPVADQPVAIGASYSYTVAATDVETNTITFSASSLPAGLSISPATGAISGTPTSGPAGATRTATITATDNGIPNRASSVSINFVFSAYARPTSTIDIQISEVSYQNTGGGRIDQFIELYNPTTSVLGIGGLRLTDYNYLEGTPDVEPGTATPHSLDYVIPNFDRLGFPSVLAPAGSAVIWIVDPATGGAGSPFPYSASSTDREYTSALPDGVLWSSGDDVWMLAGNYVIGYVAWGTPDGGATNELGAPPPPELKIWDASFQPYLSTAGAATSISNASVFDPLNSACWEITTSGAAAGNGCATPGLTRDTEAGTPVRSPGSRNIS